MSLRRILAKAWFGRRASRAVEAAYADLAALRLEDAVARRTAAPVAARRRPFALRALAAAVAHALETRSVRDACLPWALAVLGEARRLGYGPSLVLGVRGQGEAASSHAWLVLDGAPFLEAADRVAAFAPIATFPQGRA